MAVDTIFTTVVDDHDQVIGKRAVSDLKQNERYRDVSVILRNSAGDFLAAKRSAQKTVLPDHWGPSVTGSVEMGESYEQNAYKELAEELGLTDIPLTFVGNFCIDYTNFKVSTGLFTGLYNRSLDLLKLQQEEVDEVGWIDLKTLISWFNGSQKVTNGFRYVINALGLETPPLTDEFAHVVDADDTLRCYKSRRQLTMRDIIRTTSVWIEDGNGNVLTQKRSNTLAYWPGLIDGAGGGMINNLESPEVNAIKEMREELGIQEPRLRFVQKTFVDASGQRGGHFCYWYTGIIDQPVESFTFSESDVESVQWVPKTELLDHRDAHPELYMSSSKMWRELFGSKKPQLDKQNLN